MTANSLTQIPPFALKNAEPCAKTQWTLREMGFQSQKMQKNHALLQPTTSFHACFFLAENPTPFASTIAEKKGKLVAHWAKQYLGPSLPDRQKKVFVGVGDKEQNKTRQPCKSSLKSPRRQRFNNTSLVGRQAEFYAAATFSLHYLFEKEEIQNGERDRENWNWKTVQVC
jgi:hypothetical protein